MEGNAEAENYGYEGDMVTDQQQAEGDDYYSGAAMTDAGNGVAKSEYEELLTGRSYYGCEAFFGGIPRDTTEDDIRALCSAAGTIREIRLPKDKESGLGKGFAFVLFETKSDVKKAIRQLNDSMFKGKKIRVDLSDSKNRIFIGNIPKEMPKDEIIKAVLEKGDGVVHVDLLTDPDKPTRNRGFTFIEYKSNMHAERARKKMTDTQFRLGNQMLTVNWAEPRIEADEEAMAQVKIVYVRNLPESLTDETLRKTFEVYGPLTQVIIPSGPKVQIKNRRPRDYGFVHFEQRADALKAIEALNHTTLEGRTIECSLAKPPDVRAKEKVARDSRQPIGGSQQQQHQQHAFPQLLATPPTGYRQQANPMDPYSALGRVPMYGTYGGVLGVGGGREASYGGQYAPPVPSASAYGGVYGSVYGAPGLLSTPVDPSASAGYLRNGRGVPDTNRFRPY
mmetsp:Transcript_25971/g.42622  ORF Transcript_25971/g.42622 Transcript_25971/m.42622 type:complete len:449 (+) Transcript_25971:114-1460(+)